MKSLGLFIPYFHVSGLNKEIFRIILCQSLPGDNKCTTSNKQPQVHTQRTRKLIYVGEKLHVQIDSTHLVLHM